MTPPALAVEKARVTSREEAQHACTGSICWFDSKHGLTLLGAPQGAQRIQGSIRGTASRRGATAELQEKADAGAKAIQASVRGMEKRTMVHRQRGIEAAEASSSINAVASGREARRQTLDLLRARQDDPRKGAAVRQLRFIFRRLLGDELRASIETWRTSTLLCHHVASAEARLGSAEREAESRVGDRDTVIADLETQLRALQLKARH